MKMSHLCSVVFRKTAPKDKVGTTNFAHFIREASSEEKKKLYTTVLNKANEDQKAIIKEAEKLHGAKASCA